MEHALEDILIIVMSAILCGLDQLADIMIHALNRAEFFRENYGITQITSKPTLSRVLNIIDGNEAAKVVVDDKAVRGTTESGKPHSALQILIAYLTENSVVIGQNAIHD